MITYDVTIRCHESDAPGLRRTTDAVFDAMVKAGCDRDALDVEVHGPPELQLAWR